MSLDARAKKLYSYVYTMSIVTPTVSWTGVNVPSDSIVTVNGNRFFNEITFSNVQTSHGGPYTCHADITIYSISIMKTILLIVEGMLTFKDTVHYSLCNLEKTYFKTRPHAYNYIKHQHTFYNHRVSTALDFYTFLVYVIPNTTNK